MITPNQREPKDQTEKRRRYIQMAIRFEGPTQGGKPEAIQEGGSRSGYKSRGADRVGEARDNTGGRRSRGGYKSRGADKVGEARDSTGGSD